jgi:plasmid stabilization system protein ParE
MSYPVYWTKEANETFDLTINFIEKQWGEKEAGKFINRTLKLLLTIAKHPYLFKASVSQNVRKGAISKQCSVFYEVHADKIIILFFWDNRQEPIL